MVTTRKGFTIIEILIVVGVIALIGGAYYGLNRESDPIDTAKKIIDPSSAAKEECMRQCDAVFEKDASAPRVACINTCAGVGNPDPTQNLPGNQTYLGEVLAGSSSPLIDFTEADYEAVLKTDKLIVLYFYANWCPICKTEVAEALYPVFNALTRNDIVGFRVNFNDDETEAAEKELAREFGVAYQHTKVFVKNGVRVLKSPESWNKGRYIDEIEKAI